jgi:DNA-binding FadR family transcriptional regulator
MVHAANNPVLRFQIASAIEAMQPLMNMITFTQRDRAVIIDFHTTIADAIDVHDANAASNALTELANYTMSLGEKINVKPD